MCRKYAIPFLMTLGIATAGWGLEASMGISPGSLVLAPGAMADVEVRVSSPEQIGAVQFTVEYSSSAATFVSAQKGNALPSNWTIQIFQNVAGGNTNPALDRNVLVQLIGSGVNYFTGVDRQVALLRFQMAPTTCKQTPLDFSITCQRTHLSTVQLITICSPTLSAGHLATECPSDAPGVQRVWELSNVPNPFNPSTTIEFEIDQAGRVALRVFDVAGRIVRHLVDSELPGGRHQVLWDGRDDAGKTLPGGVYFYQLSTRGESVARRTVLLK